MHSALLAGLVGSGFNQPLLQASPIYADGDIAPQGAPDGRIDLTDYLLAQRIVLGETSASPSDLAHGDVYPPAAPDGAINVQDALLLQRQLLATAGGSIELKTLTLFANGPAVVTTPIDPTASANLIVDGYTGPGASVVNNPYAIDPDDPDNIIWHLEISGGVANTYLRTGNLTNDPLFDTGFDLSGAGDAQLVFDLRVNSLQAGAQITVKIDSGYPALGQRRLTSEDYTLSEWRRVTVSLAELLSDPGPGPGLDLANVANAFVIEVTGGAANFDLDNIFISRTCSATGSCNAGVKVKPEPIIYSLVWSDEFEGNTLDTSKWVPETGYGGNYGWGNDEWQLYTGSQSNVSVADGNLVINARCAQPPNCGKRNGTITSARINTLGKFAFKYGKVEARLKPPVGKGMWPAFWMLGRNFPTVGWPRTGEIDVMEIHNRYSNERTTHFTLHYCDENKSDPCQYDPGWTYTTQYKTFPYSLGDDYHVFSAEWDEAGITGKIDGQTYFYLAIDPATMDEFLKEFFMILNVAVGGTLGGTPDNTTTWPQTMLVDYVRVYQADGGDGTFTIGNGPVSPTLGIYSETHTDSMLEYANIINGADFGGNVTNTNSASIAVAPAEGNVVLQADYLNTGKYYGGFIFNFGSGRDISPYQTLEFAINTTGTPDFDDMVVQLENPGSGQPAPKVYLADYSPYQTSGDWAYYSLPLADFLGQQVALSLNNVVYLGLWNPRAANGQLTYGTLYFDNIHLRVVE